MPQTAAGGGEVYTFIKPNEDFLAWHDGNGRKLNGSFIWNWHLNREGSYSVSYLVQSLAFTKYLQDCYEKTVVAGLSQGGAAALFSSLQSQPTLAIIASGHSLLNYDAEWSGHAQLIGVPGYADLFSSEIFTDAIGITPTLWLFSWGIGESGTYKMEAEEGITANAIRTQPNVEVAIHGGGHIFPITAIRAFLEQRLPQAETNR